MRRAKMLKGRTATLVTVIAHAMIHGMALDIAALAAMVPKEILTARGLTDAKVW